MKRMVTIAVARSVLLVTLLVGGLDGSARADVQAGEQIVTSTCVTCHRIEGEPMGRRFKQAPDLIWAGDKYQRKWLVSWLKDPNFRLYPMGYDFKEERKRRHLKLSASDANRVADFLATLKDSRVKQGVMGNVTKANIERGKARYEVLQCFACHRTPARNPQGYMGGETSTALRHAGKRYQADWLYRFNQNPLDYVPDSAAFVPSPTQNVTEQDVFDITAYMMTWK